MDIIYNYGGIYLDTDVEIIKPLDDLLEYEGFAGVEDSSTYAIFELTNAILLLILFKDIKVKGRIAKASKFFASSVFGIYLLHEHPSIRNIIWNTELYNTLLKVDLPIYICLTVFISIGLLLICFVIDKVRYYIGKIISKAPIINRLMDKLTTLENNINQRKDNYL